MAEFDPPVTTSPSTDASAQPFDAAWVLEGRADLDSVETTLLELDLAGTRTARSDDRILSLVPRLDLTSLNGDDTPEAIHTLCRRARGPIGEASGALRVAAVCVHPYFLELARREVEGSGVRVAVVAGGFPFGLSTLRQRVAEVEECAAQGADEIDTVINRSLALTGEWERLHEELVALRGAAGRAMLKVILATGELGSLENVAFAARTALLAGADFVKTSTGKEAVNATFPSGLVMLLSLIHI